MPSIALKRINKEIQNFNEKTYYNTLIQYSKALLDYLAGLKLEIYVLNNANKDTYFLLIKDTKNEQILQLAYPEFYPFKPYSVINYKSKIMQNICSYNNKSYYKYLINVSNAIKHKDKNIYAFFYSNLYGREPLFLNLNNNDCYCCNSVTCLNLWSPALTINSIILEQLEIRFIETYCSDNGYKYLSAIYNNLLHVILGKLPEEIIKIILK